MLREQGLGPLPVEAVRDFIGRGMPRLVERSLEAAGLALPCERLEAALRSFGAHYARLNGSSSRPFPGVLEGLERMRLARLRLACVTNKASAYTLPLLEAPGLAPLFDTIVRATRPAAASPTVSSAAACCWFPTATAKGRGVRSFDADGVVATLGEAADLLLA